MTLNMASFKVEGKAKCCLEKSLICRWWNQFRFRCFLVFPLTNMIHWLIELVRQMTQFHAMNSNFNSLLKWLPICLLKWLHKPQEKTVKNKPLHFNIQSRVETKVNKHQEKQPRNTRNSIVTRSANTRSAQPKKEIKWLVMTPDRLCVHC